MATHEMIDKINEIIVPNDHYDDPLYKNQSPDVTVVGDGHRTYQLEVLEQFEHEQFCALIAPCGSGKSTAQVALAILDANDNHRLQVFVVPQTVIADGFFAQNGEWKKISIQGKVYNVRVLPQNNLCQPENPFCESPIERLREILLTPRELMGFQDLFVMTTSAALARVWKANCLSTIVVRSIMR